MDKEPIIIVHTFNVPVEKLWNAITVLSEMKQWYFPMLEAFEPKEGFETRFDVQNDDTNYLHLWKITEVIPLKKISYEWLFGGYPGKSLLTFELVDDGAKSQLILKHENVETFRGDIYPALSKEIFYKSWQQIIGESLAGFLA